MLAAVNVHEDGTRHPQGPIPSVTESACYVGIVPLILALTGLIMGRRRIVLVLAVALGIAWAFALGFPPLIQFAFHAVPGANMGDVRRIMPTTAFLVIILAAFGFERLHDRRGATAAVVIGLFLTAVTVTVWLSVRQAGVDGVWSHLEQRQRDRFGMSLESSGFLSADYIASLRQHVHRFVLERSQRSLLWTGAATVALLAFLFRRRLYTRLIGGAVISILTVADLGWFHYRYNPFVTARDFSTVSQVFAGPLVAGT